MAEYDSKFVNVGAKYAVWKDHINIITELRECKYSVGGGLLQSCFEINSQL